MCHSCFVAACSHVRHRDIDDADGCRDIIESPDASTSSESAVALLASPSPRAVKTWSPFLLLSNALLGAEEASSGCVKSSSRP